MTMKPLHIGLLAIGAALAGGLAVKMTQPQPVPVAVAVAPAPVRTRAPAAPPALVTRKPSPLPVPAAAPAPVPVYVETAKPAIRKDKPIQMAKAEIVPRMPALPPPYQAPKPQPAAVVSPPAAAPAPAPAPAPAVENIAPEPPRQVTLHTGMTIQVRLNESLSSDRSFAGDTFQASLAEPIVVSDLVIAERGARVGGRIVASKRASRVSGTSLIELELATLFTSDGQRIAIATDPWTKRGDTSRSADAAKIGGGAVLGAIIGALAGGGKGAAIGAGAGGGAGVGVAAATRGKPVNLPSETVIRFRLASTLTITERR